MCTLNGNYEEPYFKGEQFEIFVRTCLFVDRYYDLLEKSPLYTTNKALFSKSALKPDFKLEDWYTGKQFYVEAKYRSSWTKDMSVRWTYDLQFARYQTYNKECPTFLILGVGGSPTRPDLVTLLPIALTSIELRIHDVMPFRVDTSRAIRPETLWYRF